DQEEINESYRSLLELLGSMDPKVIFDIANSIWYRQGYSVEQDFLTVNRDYFDAQVQALDFASASAPDIINRWVNDSTNGKIKKMLSEIPGDAVMYLINAIYFKGIWSNEFEKKMTRDDEFITLSGERIPCRMMHLKEHFKYFETDQFQAIDMPYGYGDFSMTILLPQAGVDINDFISNISSDDWNMWMPRFSSQEGTIEMPKFTMEYESSLNDVLKSLGMAIAFTPGEANFSKINKENNLFISNVKHKSYVKVDEEGTEAAAATSVEISLTSVRSTDFYMRVDRPFVFAIRENRSQTILFIGKMMQPETD
ncbi:MAG: serpin family protein, partial [candidate division KSB1 bacterium]|nr:serpin family protein [candidate division KSB1 bacterium]